MKLSPSDCPSRHEGIQVGKEGSHPFLCRSCSPKSDATTRHLSQHLSRFNRIAHDGGVERVNQIAHESVTLYRFQRLALASLALALGLDRGGIAADLANHELERDRLAEMLLQRGAQLVLVHPFSQMLGRERQAQFHAFAVETAQLALLREQLGDAADLELIGERRPVAVERLARYGCRGQ